MNKYSYTNKIQNTMTELCVIAVISESLTIIAVME